MHAVSITQLMPVLDHEIMSCYYKVNPIYFITNCAFISADSITPFNPKFTGLLLFCMKY
jgi:hypothetical protein